ncbi:DUF1149 family protein [Companilactobacillus metriopterae]|uniref:DUF1149 family protein n=1 Tax=Companilactobacillus metriopterae TaxID=1909267 RepID=UPI00100A4A43|nr:DUF1149 family protein [Companilactobacillus metriopterae]
MKANRGPIQVDSFHYDVEAQTAEVSQDIQVNTVKPDLKDQDGNVLDDSEGAFFQIVIPFDIHTENAPFRVTGLLGQVIQLVDFHGDASEIDGEEIKRLSRPLIEYIETLTYQVTAITLNKGVSLNFTANENQ